MYIDISQVASTIINFYNLFSRTHLNILSFVDIVPALWIFF